ncbi:tyrosine-type recombinase/integrase [Flagellimonas taeanensis]
MRHTWATTAKNLGISIALISEGLGHSSISTTETYLKDFQNAALDEMN